MLNPQLRHVAYLNPISHIKWNSNYYQSGSTCNNMKYEPSLAKRGLRPRVNFPYKFIQNVYLKRLGIYPSVYYCVGNSPIALTNENCTIPMLGYSIITPSSPNFVNLYNGAITKNWNSTCKATNTSNSIHINSYSINDFSPTNSYLIIQK